MLPALPPVLAAAAAVQAAEGRRDVWRPAGGGEAVLLSSCKVVVRPGQQQLRGQAVDEAPEAVCTLLALAELTICLSWVLVTSQVGVST